MYQLKKHIPNLLSFSRFTISPFLFFFIYLENKGLAFFSFLFCIISDMLDGYLARKLDACSNLGGYLDIIADFTFVFLALISFIMKSVYPYWILILISIIFLQFILTSGFKKPIYDPIGKHYGTFLMGMIGIALLDYQGHIISFVPFFLLVYTVSTLVSRVLALRAVYNSNS